MEKKSNYTDWYDKELYNIDITPLYWHFQGKRYPEAGGVEYYEQNGEIYQRDDVVVVGGHIGNIEGVNVEQGVCMLGLSFDYAGCMADPEEWEMWSGYHCKMGSIRHATTDEIANYEISANLVADACERADNAYKERRAGF